MNLSFYAFWEYFCVEMRNPPWATTSRFTGWCRSLYQGLGIQTSWEVPMAGWLALREGFMPWKKFGWLSGKGSCHVKNLVGFQGRKGSCHEKNFANSSLYNVLISDSSDSTCIEDCSIAMGHDAIALKSGWDEYGIAYGRPTTNVHIRRVNLQSSSGSSLAFGSEMSGGISNVCVEQVHLYNSFSGIEFRTTKGRGGYIQEIIISDVAMENIHTAFSATGQIGSHPDDHFDPNALPVLDHITLQNVIGTNITIAGSFTGIQESPFTSICLSNISLSTTPPASISWVCSNVFGFSQWVFPEPCPSLQSSLLNSSSTCLSLLNSSPTQTAVLWCHSSIFLQAPILDSFQ